MLSVGPEGRSPLVEDVAVLAAQVLDPDLLGGQLAFKVVELLECCLSVSGRRERPALDGPEDMFRWVLLKMMGLKMRRGLEGSLGRVVDAERAGGALLWVEHPYVR
jgi:hypothetical protein